MFEKCLPGIWDLSLITWRWGNGGSETFCDFMAQVYLLGCVKV